MKIRSGFVSNSSSSSFIINVTKEKLDFWEHVSDVFDDVENIDTVEKLNSYIVDQYGCTGQTVQEVIDDSWNIGTWYETAVEKIESGSIIAFAEADNCDNSAHTIAHKFDVLDV